ncbi:hypothetical protein [Rahnella sp. ChDrAdgB13]|uniref:hypothetical protein n=1 Tax=Rahnella sp. ChDrAdgB13 TaxID=1850581 RepID=UPI001AD860B5|nr:hypothetical protein [Rahnella sp. ChDrAdgB13]
MSNETDIKLGVDLERVNKIVDVLTAEFGDDITRMKFWEELWVALVVIYGPRGAVDFIERCQTPR